MASHVNVNVFFVVFVRRMRGLWEPTRVRNLVSPLFTLRLYIEMLVIDGWQSHVVFRARPGVHSRWTLAGSLLLDAKLLDERVPS